MSASNLPHGGTFPKLTDEQRTRISAFAHERRFADGELLWEQGDNNRRPYELELGEGIRIKARTVIIATGVRYRKPDLPDLARFEGLGVYYGATQFEASLCEGAEVIVVGGGNSAGQAAVFLSRKVRHLHMLVRGEGLASTMSRYLIRRIEETPNITLRTRTRIEALEGNGALRRVTWSDSSAFPASSRSATCAPRASSASPQPWAKARCVSSSSTRCSRSRGSVDDRRSRESWPAIGYDFGPLPAPGRIPYDSDAVSRDQVV